MLRFEPSEEYVRTRGGTLERRVYIAETDEHGFIRSSNVLDACKSIIVLGDSVTESMFLDPDRRFPARLEKLLREDHGVDVLVRNGGYSGATTLHVLNTFINKVVPLKPDLVLWMTGIVDLDAARLKASFWTRDCWLDPLTKFERENEWRDTDYQLQADYSDRQRLLELGCAAARAFSIELCFATIPHRRDGGVDDAADARDDVNETTRRVARVCGRELCDLETALAGRGDIFYDAFHLNEIGGDAVAKELTQFLLAAGKI